MDRYRGEIVFKDASLGRFGPYQIDLSYWPGVRLSGKFFCYSYWYERADYSMDVLMGTDKTASYTNTGPGETIDSMTITVTRFDVNQGVLFLEGTWPEWYDIKDVGETLVYFKFKINATLVRGHDHGSDV